MLLSPWDVTGYWEISEGVNWSYNYNVKKRLGLCSESVACEVSYLPNFCYSGAKQ